MAQIMLPLFLPEGMRIDRVLRAMAGIVIFSTAYTAENVRGGLQAVPEGQVEAAKALGLSGPLITFFIVLPQALRAVVDGQDGALVVRDETGLAAMLGLKKGDRVNLANGIALRAPEDVIVSILRPLAANQAVRVQGPRGTEARELLILNAGACPV